MTSKSNNSQHYFSAIYSFSTDPSDLFLTYYSVQKSFVKDAYPVSLQVPTTLKLSFSRDYSAYDVWQKRYGFLSKLFFKPWAVNHWKKKQGREGGGGKREKGMHAHTHEGARRRFLWWIHKLLLSEIKSQNLLSPFSSDFHLRTLCHILFSQLVAVVYI